MKVVNACDGAVVHPGQTFRVPGHADATLVRIEEGLLTARLWVVFPDCNQYVDPAGRVGLRQDALDVPILHRHPRYLFQRVAFIPT